MKKRTMKRRKRIKKMRAKVSTTGKQSVGGDRGTKLNTRIRAQDQLNSGARVYI